MRTSSYGGEPAYRNAYGSTLSVDYRAKAHAVPGDPQIGGLTERDCDRFRTNRCPILKQEL